jgi:hypothetical protein
MPRPHPDPPHRRRRRTRSSSGAETKWGAPQGHLSRKLAERRFQRRVRFAAFALLFCLATLITLFVLKDASKARTSGDPKPTPEKVLEDYQPPPESPEDKSNAAMAAFDEFLQSGTPASKLPVVFDPANESDAVLDYYTRRGRTDPEGIHDRKVTAILEKDREILIITFKDDGDRTWAAPFEWKTNAYRLHWGSMTGYGELPWDRFLTERPAKPVPMRVNVYIPDSESPPLIPPDHTFVLITHPELEKPLGTLLAPSKSLNPLLKLPRNTDIPAKVSMQWRDFKGAGNWPVITDLIHRNWIR